MKGIVFIKEMLDARDNGATMFIVPIERKKLLESLEYFNNFYSDDKGMLKEIYETAIKNDSLVQKGDEFFIQEEFAELLEDIDDIGSEKIYYRFDGEINDCMDSDYEAIDTPWKDASQMQEHQARHKDVCLGIEVKRTWDITHEDFKAMGYDVINKPISSVRNFYREQGLDIEDNSYVFLVTYKVLIMNRIDDTQEIIIHKDQSDRWDYMKIINGFCQDCSFVAGNRCIAGNSEFFSVDLRDKEIDFSSCLEHTEKDFKIDTDTGVL